LPFGPKIATRCTKRFLRELRWTNEVVENARRTDSEKWDWAIRQSYSEAVYRQNWLPSREEDLLPTALGNTLSTGEIRAGERYLLKLELAMPRLAPLLSERTLAELRDRRNQLDAAVRLSVAAGLATAISLGLLVWRGHWVFLPLATYLMCWLCYRSAVAAARGFSDSLAAAVDLHHLQLFDAMQLERPASLPEEWDRNTDLEMLFKNEVDRDLAAGFRYVAPKADEPPAE
jgi:uncharacterized membrane protein YccC